MDERLYKATMEGNRESLVDLIRQDPLILERINSPTTPYLETPLHIAAMLGHEGVAVELMRRKPGLARELDSRGSSPLHVAAAKGDVGIVRSLVSADPDTCTVCDREGRNPVHVAARMGRIGALREMLKVKPEAARAVIRDGTTVLHMCVEHNQFDALKIILETMDFQDLVNKKDKFGNTILHLAVADKQVQTTEFLLCVPGMDINAVNHNGITALDILIQRRRDIRDFEMEESFKQAGATGGGQYSNSPTPFLRRITTVDRHTSIKHTKKAQKNTNTTNKDDWLDKKRSALMVVASLIATMAFQVGVSPPDNTWPANSTPPPPPPPPPPNNTTNINTSDRRSPEYYIREASRYLKKGEHFYIINTTTFIASLSIILLLMSGLPLNSRFFMWILLMITWIAISGLALSYSVAVVIVAPETEEKSINRVVGGTVFVWICLITLLLFGHTIRLLIMMLRMVFRILKLIINSLFGRKRRIIRSNTSNTV